VRTSDFDYDLPPELIAQTPVSPRDQSRLMVVDRTTGQLNHHRFAQLSHCLRSGDVLVLNDSRVIKARLRTLHAQSRSPIEILLLRANGPNDYWAMVRPGKRARLHTRLLVQDGLGQLTAIAATVIDKNSEGHRRLLFTNTENLAERLEELGEVPLPPYIRRSGPSKLADDVERYQTVYAQRDGSVAAPTAGLHFTQSLLEQIRRSGVHVCAVTLHVGLGTFAPVKAETLAGHVMHEEHFHVEAGTADAVNLAKREGRRVVAVGTTTVRVLESLAARHHGQIAPGTGTTNVFIYPPFRFQIVDALLTNFHLPRSTLLMLVSAFVAPGKTHGRERLLAAYAEATRERYRFYSYGDAMLIL
jgi:S-adenosylmethionine:tRNA ribosyltransferase-isomerase